MRTALIEFMFCRFKWIKVYIIWKSLWYGFFLLKKISTDLFRSQKYVSARLVSFSIYIRVDRSLQKRAKKLNVMLLFIFVRSTNFVANKKRQHENQKIEIRLELLRELLEWLQIFANMKYVNVFWLLVFRFHTKLSP